MNSNDLILVTGASGYIGGCLVPRLLEKGYRVRCLTRNPTSLQNRSWFSQVEIVQGDILASAAVYEALENVRRCYYLVHSMSSGQRYIEQDRLAATNFGAIAGRAGVQQIIYLGGLADPTSELSSHMRSRVQTGELLRHGGVAVTEFRASMIIGAGSISFEMIRFLTEQFPVLVGPSWCYNNSQPIAIENVLDYLLAALETAGCENQVFEIGGKDLISYAQAMLIYGSLRGLKRKFMIAPWIPVGWLAFGVELFTPVPANIARPLIDGMHSQSIVKNSAASIIFPDIQPDNYRSAVTQALNKLSPTYIEPVWENCKDSVKITKHAGFLIDSRRVNTPVQPWVVFSIIVGLGCKRGWLSIGLIWRIRGLLDRLVGGTGMRSRQDGELIVGSYTGFYSVETIEPDRLLRLRAEVKAPGAGWLEWLIKPLPEGGVQLLQTAYFAPKGFAGFFYWYFLLPIRRLAFAGLIKHIVRQGIAKQCD